VLSVLVWQPESLPWQWLFQSLLIIGIVLHVYNLVIPAGNAKKSIVVFSEQGSWIEISHEQQVQWHISAKSRLISFLLFIHLSSAVNPATSKWYLIFKDQLSTADFRRLCRVILFKQQTTSRP
jgi:hypothetical protein